MRAAFVTVAVATAVLFVATAPISSGDTSERQIGSSMGKPSISDDQRKTSDQFADLSSHNITQAQAHAATHKSPGAEAILGPSLTDAQIAAIIAADEDTVRPSIQSDHYNYDSESHHLDQIYKTVDAGLSLHKIHEIFHSEDSNRPVNLTDAEISEAITEHNAAVEWTRKKGYRTKDADRCYLSSECWPNFGEMFGWE